MGYMDRKYDDFETADRGPVRRFFDRLFENVENPLGWSVRMFRFRGIDARIHLATVVFILGYLISSISVDRAGLPFIAPAMASLFVIVLLHEFGHCFACRAVGGQADRIVMLPFGGLAFTRPPHDWKSHLYTTLGGPAVNVALFPITSLALVLAGASGAVLFNPFAPSGTYNLLATGSNLTFYALLALWSFHYINIVILGFNVLLPFFPLDGGRIVQALLWKSKGYRSSMETATLIGFAGAGLLAIISIFLTEMLLLIIALFGFWACWVERQRIRADVELAEVGAGPLASGLGASLAEAHDAPPRPVRPSRTEIRRQKQEEADAVELDRLLAKIGSQGMESLSRTERKTLDRLSKKKRQS